MIRRGPIRDDFAGPGGWDEALLLLGLHDVVGLEWDEAACATRAAAGHRTIRTDVAEYPNDPFVGRLWGYIASPPCQAWSQAGKGGGHDDVELVLEAMRDLAAGRDTRAALAEKCEDPRSMLVVEPVRQVRDLRPTWVALEQVPPVLDLWRDFARIFQGWGYSTWTGILNAADFGVPQTRRRAILIASLERPALPPEPTHAENPVAGLFGPELRPWVSMADALGWGEDGYVRQERGAGMLERHGPRRDHPATEPAPTLTAGGARFSGGPRWQIDRGTNSKAAGWRADPDTPTVPSPPVPDDAPAPTVTSSAKGWKREPILVNTGRDWKPGGTREDAQTFDATEQPAPTIDGKGRWHVLDVVLSPGLTPSQPNRRTYELDEPAPTIAFGHDAASWKWEERRNDQSGSGEVDPEWPLHRPATTVAGRDLVGDPGPNANRFNGAEKSRNDGYRVTETEAGLLQTFRPDYPWQGNRSKRFEQIGNAVPPLLAAHVIAAVAGLPAPIPTT